MSPEADVLLMEGCPFIGAKGHSVPKALCTEHVKDFIDNFFSWLRVEMVAFQIYWLNKI